MSESSSTPWQTSASRLNEGSDGNADQGLNDGELTEGLDLGFDGAEDILRVWRRGIRPDPDLTVSQWADAHRKLSSRPRRNPDNTAQRGRRICARSWMRCHQTIRRSGLRS